MSDDETQAQAEAQADFHAWLADASLPETSHTVVGKGKLKAVYDDLERQLRASRDLHSNDDRLVDPAFEIAKRMEEISAEMRASQRTFRFRALTGPEVKAIRSSAPKDESGEPDADHIAAAWLATSCVSHDLTPEDFAQTRALIGEGQFNALWTAAFGVGNDRQLDVPFSLAASVILSNRDS